MPRVKVMGYITCFYCGKRSSTRYDGVIREFLCLHCDATNYLDKNGEITDPPVAKTTAAPKSTFAIPRSQSPIPSSPLQSIFCPTCVKNQHLFTSSLAQYLPDDPSHPDYPELEKNLYKFRRRLEDRYPQICADCEPKVMAKLDQAGYTARTDHLRRMMDRSRNNRSTPKQQGTLYLVDKLGKWLWIGGLVCQLLWHISVTSSVISDSATVAGEQILGSEPSLLLERLINMLPAPEVLIWTSICANVASVWWNPKFVQVFRGFSRHVLGLSQWYTFQGLVIFIRFMAMRVTAGVDGRAAEPSAQFSAHAFLGLVVTLVYVLAGRSVRIDTTPLFEPSDATTSPLRAGKVAKDEGTNSMSNVLDEILAETTAHPRSRALPGENLSVTRLPRSSINSSRNAAASSSLPLLQQDSTSYQKSALGFGSLGLSEQQHQSRAEELQYSEEMDWSPTNSKHRAFSEYGTPQRQSQGFGQSPTDPDARPFWYKVPPAPTTPAQRLRNPAKVPLLRSKPAGNEAVFFPANGSPKQSPPTQNADEPKRAVAFAQPSFFPPSNANDPRNSLAELLGASFSLSQEEHEQESRDDSTAHATRPRSSPKTRGLRSSRLLDAFILTLLLGPWLHAIYWPHKYSSDVMLGSLGFSILIACRLTVDTIRDMINEPTTSWAAITNTSLGIAELATGCHLGLQLWGAQNTGNSIASQGGWFIGSMIVHQMWNAAF